jgi:CRISPR-associated protein Cas1
MYEIRSLALDLAEEFRPLVADSTVITLINSRQLEPADFTTTSLGCSLKQNGRKKLIKAYEERMATQLRHPVFKYSLTYRRTLDIQARLLAAVLVGDLAEYTPLMTR